MMRRRKPDATDVLIIGAGAAGGTAAKVLTEAGLRVVCLERGPWLKPEDFSGDELKYINREFFLQDGILKPRTRRSNVEEKAVVTRWTPTPQMVGGGTVHWNGWFPRPTEDDLRSRSLYGNVAGSSLVDWPVSYAELEPYYSRVEWEFGSSGLVGSNKFEPPHSRPYPCPPVPATGFGKAFYRGCKQLDYNAYPLPQGVLTTPHKGRPASSFSGFWHEYGDAMSGKSSTLASFIPEALATGRLDLRAECYVREITVGADGRATGAVYVDAQGFEFEQEAKAVLLCCGGIESARLLLMSKSSLFPDGLANSSGQVGRNFMSHEYVFAVGLFDKQVHEPVLGWTGSNSNGATYEFYKTDMSRDHMLGGLVAASIQGHPINWNVPGRPLWGQAAKDADRDFFNHSMKVGVSVQDLPQETNTVDLDDDVTDAWGLPVARITVKPHANDIAQGRWIVDRCAEILQAAGADRITPVYMTDLTGNCFHEMGTARMGLDPARSVVDSHCRSHDVDNLFIPDGSAFPTSLGVNPTLTIMAIAWRSAESIVRQLQRGGLHRELAPAHARG